MTIFDRQTTILALAGMLSLFIGAASVTGEVFRLRAENADLKAAIAQCGKETAE